MPSTVTLTIFLLFLLGTVTPQGSYAGYYASYPQRQQQFAQQQFAYYSNPRSYDRYSNPVYHSQGYDRVWGGPSSLGWSQVPRHWSPQYSPVYGRRK